MVEYHITTRKGITVKKFKSRKRAVSYGKKNIKGYRLFVFGDMPLRKRRRR